MRITAFALLTLLVLPATGNAAPVDLNTFLPEMEDAAKPTVTLRADGKLTTVTPEGTKSDQILLIHRGFGGKGTKYQDGKSELQLSDQIIRSPQ
ncbi:hypothetical protein B4Q13_25355 [Lacticaseibacillus rhamnosus]